MEPAKVHLLSKEVEDLMTKGAITPCREDRAGFVSQLFLVPKSDSSFCEDSQSHYPEGRLAAEVGFKRCVPVGSHTRGPPEVPEVLLGGQNLAVQGLAILAPQTFLKPVVCTLRSLGVRLILYLDDMLIMAQST